MRFYFFKEGDLGRALLLLVQKKKSVCFAWAVELLRVFLYECFFFNLSVCVFSGSSTSRNTLWLWACVALQAQLYSRSCMFVLYPRLPEQVKWWAGSLFFLKQFLCVCDWYNLNLVEHLWNSQTLVLPKPTLCCRQTVSKSFLQFKQRRGRNAQCSHTAPWWPHFTLWSLVQKVHVLLVVCSVSLLFDVAGH